jgi:futalosine hydrolase
MSRSLSKTLLCIPTELEAGYLRDADPKLLEESRWAGVAVIGFGPVAAAASTALLIAAQEPEHILLVGIAGTYLGEEAVGTAASFGSVSLDGVGAGEGGAFLSPARMGFPQWSPEEGAPVFDHLALADDGAELVSVCAAADGPAMLAHRRARFPEAVAEDMESFGVALAAHMAGVPITVLRGLSNQAGNRDPKTWAIEAALGAVAARLRSHYAG